MGDSLLFCPSDEEKELTTAEIAVSYYTCSSFEINTGSFEGPWKDCTTSYFV